MHMWTSKNCEQKAKAATICSLKNSIQLDTVEFRPSKDDMVTNYQSIWHNAPEAQEQKYSVNFHMPQWVSLSKQYSLLASYFQVISFHPCSIT